MNWIIVLYKYNIIPILFIYLGWLILWLLCLWGTDTVGCGGSSYFVFDALSFTLLVAGVLFIMTTSADGESIPDKVVKGGEFETSACGFLLGLDILIGPALLHGVGVWVSLLIIVYIYIFVCCKYLCDKRESMN